MAAATTPNAPNPIDWAWPGKPTTTNGSNSNESKPLELQFLPPAASALPSSSPWGVDPSRLQQLMMGSVAASTSSSSSSSGAAVITATSVVAAAGATSSSRGSMRDLGALFDHGINKPLPSGWERCLDLKSGEVFIKKCDANMNSTGTSQTLIRPHFTQRKNWKESCTVTSIAPQVSLQIDEQRQDWSLRWVQGKATLALQQEAVNSSKSFINVTTKIGGEEDDSSSPDREPLCLDLDLRLTSKKRSKSTSEAQDISSSRALKLATCKLTSTGISPQNKVQQWKWQQRGNSGEKPTSIQEMVKESTMATAVCSKCLMYVLLRKSNPVCPRCSNLIILDCGLLPSANKKRPHLELSPDDLSLSTDSSR